MQQLIDIFIEPGKTFEQLKEKPTFLIPALLSAISIVVIMFLYFNKVDTAWMFDQQVLASGQEMTPEQLAQMKQFEMKGSTMAIFGAVGTVIFLAIVYCLMAVYYLVAGKFTGHEISFRHGLSLTAWSGMPLLLGTIIALVGVFGMQPQTLMDSLFLTHPDPLLVDLPIDHPWKTFMTKTDLLSIWSVALGALGWKIWTRSSWLQATVVSALPTVVIYGAMAASAALKS